jgi:hypothetical protein
MDDRDGEDGILTAICRPHQGNSLGSGKLGVVVLAAVAVAAKDGGGSKVEGWELRIED